MSISDNRAIRRALRCLLLLALFSLAALLPERCGLTSALRGRAAEGVVREGLQGEGLEQDAGRPAGHRGAQGPDGGVNGYTLSGPGEAPGESGEGRFPAAAPGSSAPGSSADPSRAAQRSAPLPVCVSGAVERPGVYYLPEGALWLDALQAAGGALSEAAVEEINLARPLRAHEMVRIPTREEWRAGLRPEGEEGRTPRGTEPEGGAASEAAGRISLNRASLLELQAIPGVGEKTARLIIAYREAQGPFRSTEELMKIAGIKEARYNRMKDYVQP